MCVSLSQLRVLGVESGCFCVTHSLPCVTLDTEKNIEHFICTEIVKFVCP